jgi:threonine aldolase
MRIITLADLEKVSEPLAVLLLELPQREIGGWLPAWEDLVAQTDWARQRGIPLHMDGARLWESGPFYDRPYPEIAGLFDSVYVSFYKGLAGMTGSILSGTRDFIAEARIWQRRHGGNLFHMYPYVLTARRGMEKRLPRMAEYHRKALELAEVLASIPGIEITPNPPHTHMMHVYLKGNKERLERAALELSRRTGVWLFDSLTPTALPGLQKLEVSAGDATLQISADEFRELFQSLLEMADR